MHRLRRFLAAIFALLSIFFAYQAFVKERETKVLAEQNFNLNWGHNVFTGARKIDSLVFVDISIDKNENIFQNLEDLFLKHKFIKTSLDKHAYPADYGLLKYISERSKLKGELSCAVLSPRGYPIQIVGAQDASATEELFGKTLLPSLEAYTKNRESVRFALNLAISKMEKNEEIFDILDSFVENTVDAGKANFYSLLGLGDMQNTPAVFTENVRVLARLTTLPDRVPMDIEARLRVLLAEKLNDKNLKKSERLLIVRAAYDCLFLHNYGFLSSVVYKNSELLLEELSKNPFLLSDKKAFLRDNALAVSVLAKAYKFYGDERFLNASQKLLDSLMEKFSSRRVAPAIVWKEGVDEIFSEAGALDYMLVCRANMDFYFASKNKDYLLSMDKIFQFLDADFMDENTGAWFENSKRSVFANVMRYKLSKDGFYPSTTGEGLQLLADLSSIGEGISPRYIQIFNALKRANVSLNFINSASMRLAIFANPMASYNDDEKLADL